MLELSNGSNRKIPFDQCSFDSDNCIIHLRHFEAYGPDLVGGLFSGSGGVSRYIG